MKTTKCNSRVFGYNLGRIIILLITAGIFAYMLNEGEKIGMLISGILFVALALFSIGTQLSEDKLKVDISGIPVKTIPVADIKDASRITSSPFFERNTFGAHVGGLGWSFHVGAPNLLITLANGNTYRVSVDDPNAFISALHKQLAPAA